MKLLCTSIVLYQSLKNDFVELNKSVTSLFCKICNQKQKIMLFYSHESVNYDWGEFFQQPQTPLQILIAAIQYSVLYCLSNGLVFTKSLLVQLIIMAMFYSKREKCRENVPALRKQGDFFIQSIWWVGAQFNMWNSIVPREYIYEIVRERQYSRGRHQQRKNISILIPNTETWIYVYLINHQRLLITKKSPRAFANCGVLFEHAHIMYSIKSTLKRKIDTWNYIRLIFPNMFLNVIFYLNNFCFPFSLNLSTVFNLVLFIQSLNYNTKIKMSLKFVIVACKLKSNPKECAFRFSICVQGSGMGLKWSLYKSSVISSCIVLDSA